MSPLSLALAAALALAGCAAATHSSGPSAGSATLRLGERALIAGVSIRAVRVEEDSRCPLSVQCVQAGTVRLAVAIGGGAQPRPAVLALDRPEEVEPGRWLRLAAVCPPRRSPGAIGARAYRFVITGSAGAPPPPLDHSCPPPP